jgi:hypothetical protein
MALFGFKNARMNECVFAPKNTHFKLIDKAKT